MKSTVRDTCGVLRVFLRYAHREGVLPRDLSEAVEWPQVYRLSTVPRSITWAEVGTVLAAVDRRTPCGTARLRDPAAAGDLRAARPRDRRVDAGRHRLETGTPRRPGAQGRALDRVPAVPGGRRGAGRLPAAWPTTDQRPARVLPRCGTGGADRHRRGVVLRPRLPAQGRCRRSLARDRTRCATPACSDSSTTTSR